MLGNQVEEGTRKLATISRDNTSRVWVSRDHGLNAGEKYAAITGLLCRTQLPQCLPSPLPTSIFLYSI